MTSYYLGERTGRTINRLAGDVQLSSRDVAAGWVNRHPDQVRRRCRPMACDIATRAALYDLDMVAATFTDTPRRFRELTSCGA